MKRKIKKIYFVGIKGVGMTSLAVLCKQAGFEIRGSDVSEKFITDVILKREGISIDLGFDAKYLERFFKDSKKDESLVIVTAAHGGLSNEQAVFAKDKRINVLTHGQAIGELMRGEIFGGKDVKGISIAGSHGKTTISAMLAFFLSRLGFDPSYAVGTSEIFGLGPCGHYGSGDLFIAEADEYISDLAFDRTPKLLYQKPQFAIFNNIDFDHPDYYRNVEEIEQTFLKFTDNIKEKGVLILNGDDKHTPHIIKNVNKKISVVCYGEGLQNMFRLTKVVQEGFRTRFSVSFENEDLHEFVLSVPGRHNAMNAVSCIALLRLLGVEIQRIKEVFPKFVGVKRRIEKICVLRDGAIVVDDYAHHPREIKTTLSTIKEIYPDKHIICIFQPHTYSRMEKLLDEFVSSFSLVAKLILLPIYSSAREESSDKNKKFSQLMVESFIKESPNAIFMREKDDVVEYVKNKFDDEKFVVVTMGAGDVYKISEKLKRSQGSFLEDSKIKSQN